jgi:hypothetical protein
LTLAALPLLRDLKRHPTPTFSGNQEKFVIVIFNVKNNLICEYPQNRMTDQALLSDAKPVWSSCSLAHRFPADSITT